MTKMVVINETPTADLKVYLERLEAQLGLYHNKRVTQTIRIKAGAIRRVLKERVE